MKKNIETVSAQELAKILGLTDRRIQQLVPEVFNREGRGAYDLAKCVQAYIEYQKNQVRAKTGSKEEEETRWTKLRADKTEVEIKALTGQLIPAEEVGNVWAQVMAALRSKMLSIPSNLKIKRPDIDMDGISFVEKEIRGALEEASRDGMAQRYRDTAGQGSGAAEAASKTDPE